MDDSWQSYPASEIEAAALGHVWRVGWRKVIVKEHPLMLFVFTRGHSSAIPLVKKKEVEKAWLGWGYNDGVRMHQGWEGSFMVS